MIEVYCDESRPEALYGERVPGQYMVIGGLWVPYDVREEIKTKIKELKSKHNVLGEFKWNKVSPSRADFYLELVDLFFNNSIRFRCIVVEGNRVDISKFHESDSELGFYKFYYQLLYHWISVREIYWIYLDYKKNKLPDRLHTLKRVLQNATSSNIKDVQAINSKESLLIQLADVFIGAVGYQLHGYSSSDAKSAVVKRIQHHLGCTISATPKGERKFNVFQIALRG